MRLGKKYKKKVNIVWTHTPVRSCIAYHGELCKFSDIFKRNDNILEDAKVDHQKTYEFRYWENKDHVVDVSGDDNVFINYALYTIISSEDDQNSIFKNLRSVIAQPQEFVVDTIGKEFGDVLKYDLQPNDDLKLEIDSNLKNFRENMIGIHVRRSDGGFANYNWKDINKILIQQSKEWCKNETNGVFLATDDMETYINFASALGNKLVIYNPPEVLCNTKSTSGNKFSNDKYNVLVGYIELNLLSHCNKLIVGTADSTFSVCAMLMSDISTKKYLINAPENVPSFI
jgi:predicted kinase